MRQQIEDEPRCPICGYTESDAGFHLDHHLCRGKIPKAESKPIVTTEPIRDAGRYDLHEFDHESGQGKCYEVHDNEPEQGCFRVELSTHYKDAAEFLLNALNAHDGKVVISEEPNIHTLLLAGDQRKDCPNDELLSAARMRHIYAIIYRELSNALLKSKDK